jgi:CBS domain-containing protein
MSDHHDTVKVKDIMTKKLIALSPDDGLDKATKLFEEHNFDGFPVMNEEGKLIGIVTAYAMQPTCLIYSIF